VYLSTNPDAKLGRMINGLMTLRHKAAPSDHPMMA
jgi:hypothetical protein